MKELDRRDLLKTTGVGAGAALGVGAGVGTAAAQQSNEVVTTFTLTGLGGFISIGEPGQEPGTKFNLPAPTEVANPIRIEAEVYEDGSWESTSVQFPDITVPDRLLEQAGLPPSVDITVLVNPIETPYTGSINRQDGEQRLTVSGSLEITVDISLINIDPITAAIGPKTGESNKLTGQILSNADSDFQGTKAAVTLVDNEFTIPSTTGFDGIDTELGLPATTPGENWFKLDAEVQFADPCPAGCPNSAGTTQPPELSVGNTAGSPNQNLTSLFDDVNGDNTTDLTDVQILFQNLDQPEVQQNASSFNFSDGYSTRVTVGDVQALFEIVAQQS